MNCGICFQNIPESGVYYLSCGHFYDIGCIHQWSLNNEICPNCEAPLDKEKIKTDVYLDTDIKFNEIYESSIKPKDYQEIWKIKVYEIYNSIVQNGVFGYVERINFIKKISIYQNKNAKDCFKAPMISMINLVMYDYDFSCFRKCKIAFYITLWISFIIGTILGFILAGVYENHLEVKILSFLLAIIEFIVTTKISISKIKLYRSYNLLFKDYIRAHSIILTHSRCDC